MTTLWLPSHAAEVRQRLRRQQAVDYAPAWGLLDRFDANAAAPLTTPRTCDPGPGTLTVTDTNSIMSVAGGVLVVNGTPAANDGLVSPSTFARVRGRAFGFDTLKRVTTSTNSRFGWSASTLADAALIYGVDHGAGLSNFRVKSGTSVIEAAVAIGSGISTETCSFLIVMRSTGAFLFARESGGTDFRLEWVYALNSAALLTKCSIITSAVNYALDNLRVIDLAGIWNTTADHFATVNVASSSDGQIIIPQARALLEHTITAATGVTQELMLRWTDDDNCWIVRMSQSGSTIKLIEKVLGVETERSSAAQTFTNGTAYRLMVIVDRLSIKTYIAAASTDALVAKNSYVSATWNQDVQAVKVSKAGANLIAWPRTVRLPRYALI